MWREQRDRRIINNDMSRSQIAWHDHNSSKSAALVPVFTLNCPRLLPVCYANKKSPELSPPGF
jgi:hypothetical protein